MSLEIYLVRHGKTVFNTTGRLQGWSDSPLLPEGRQAAEDLGRALAGKVTFDAAFSSPSPRAAETARLILSAKGQGSLPLETIDEIREYCFGGFEGELHDVLHCRIAAERGYPDMERWLEAYRSADRHLLAESVSRSDPLGLAENEAQFMTRLQEGMRLIVQKSPVGGKVLAVSHGMSITGILKSINPQSTPYKSIKNTTVSRISCENGLWCISTIGESFLHSN
ncbi:histidine phosphatase family protein [Neisseria chenwenguii]|uniref:Phosphoglycerate mutase n=1 Tax=Neisseria chenwenguii TaxID=1853278 RepID=A0A220S231_9NEIS|nr:histidine phosphatase family protein [Neisseria chenwenguii]ASK27418.1 phosphoglycerate mutase [Neisseria chenwenguii]ROV56910.1 histidine phosphatase family protein [Neisseria chenwenguii]